MEISMWCTNSPKIGIALLWLVACSVSFAADIDGVEQTLSISAPRPVAKAVEVLSDRHGLVITYEDPPYTFEGDLKDVTAIVSRSPVQPGQRVLGPRSGQLNLTYSVSPATGKLEDADGLLRRVLDTHLANGGSQFELIQQDDVFHVVPVMVKNSAGAWVATRPILDIPITVPVQPRSGAQMVDAICDALTASAKVRVVVGMAPDSALANDQVVDGGTNEPARDILSRSLKQLSKETGRRLGAGEERQYVWQLLLDPSPKTYFLNLRLLPRQAEVVTPNPDEQPSDPAAVDPTTGQKRKE
jgi:hypothetical protein